MTNKSAPEPGEAAPAPLLHQQPEAGAARRATSGWSTDEAVSHALQERMVRLNKDRAWPWMEPGRRSVGLEEDGRVVQYEADARRKPCRCVCWVTSVKPGRFRTVRQLRQRPGGYASCPAACGHSGLAARLSRLTTNSRQGARVIGTTSVLNSPPGPGSDE